MTIVIMTVDDVDRGSLKVSYTSNTAARWFLVTRWFGYFVDYKLLQFIRRDVADPGSGTDYSSQCGA